MHSVLKQDRLPEQKIPSRLGFRHRSALGLGHLLFQIGGQRLAIWLRRLC